MNAPTSFDNYAYQYDTEFTNSAIGRLQRNQVWHHLSPLLILNHNSAVLKILEVNCGTGVDAIYMAKFGHEVTSTDESKEMVAIAREKIKQNSFNSNATAEQCSFQELPTKFEGKTFDLIFSNFGGLNCINEFELKNTLTSLNNLLKPNGKMILVLMSTLCIWEMVYFGLKFQFKKAFRRLNKQESTLIKSSILQVHYYSPQKIEQLCSPNLKTEIVQPIGLFIPPSYLEPFFKNKQWILKILARAEKLFGNFSIFSNLADHYLIVLKKIR